MQFRWLAALLFTLASMPAFADMTRLELKQKQNARVAWVVDKPINEVFDAYQEYVNTHFAVSGFLWAKGSETTSALEAQSGEIAMRLKNNPFSKGVFFLVELHAAGSQTRVDYYYINGLWKKKAEKLRHLFPEVATP